MLFLFFQFFLNMKTAMLLLISSLLAACQTVTPNNPEIITVTEPVEVEKIQPEIAIDPEIQYDELSLATLMKEEIQWTDLVLEAVLANTANYTRYRISYKNGELSLSGIMNIPKWAWPFPLLVLNHGYIDTRYYTNGRGLKREQDYFANNGFAVIHPDYRNHAFSDTVETDPYDFRLGYTHDVIAAVYAVQNSPLDEIRAINSESVGMLGHSMWGGISQNIAVSKPDLIDALVLYWPVSNDEFSNFEKFQLWNATRSSRVTQVLTDHQTREENPQFWDWVSSKTFFENITAPVIIFTWTADSDTPTGWAQDIAQDLRSNNKEVEIVSYPWEVHEFWPQFSNFMQSSSDFFSENLK